MSGGVWNVAGSLLHKASLASIPPLDFKGRKLRFVKQMGEGGFAIVFLCQDESERKYAVKKCIVSEKEHMDAVQKEIDMLELLKHSNVVKILGHTKLSACGRTEVYIVMECAEGSIVNMMQEEEKVGRKFSESKLLRIFHDTVKAVAHMHSQDPPVAHRDLKVENILLGSDMNYKLCDFGSATTLATHATTYRDICQATDEIEKNTTLCYRSPEMADLHQKKRVDQGVDVWALGCTLYYLCFFSLPFDDSQLQIVQAKYTIPERHNFSSGVIDLIKLCLTPDPAARPDIWTVSEVVCQLRKQGTPCPRPTNPPSQSLAFGTGSPTSSNTTPKAQGGSPPARNQAAAGGLFGQLEWVGGDAAADDGGEDLFAQAPPSAPAPSTAAPAQAKPAPAAQTPTVAPATQTSQAADPLFGQEEPKKEAPRPSIEDLFSAPAPQMGMGGGAAPMGMGGPAPMGMGCGMQGGMSAQHPFAPPQPTPTPVFSAPAKPAEVDLFSSAPPTAPKPAPADFDLFAAPTPAPKKEDKATDKAMDLLAGFTMSASGNPPPKAKPKGSYKSINSNSGTGKSDSLFG